MAKYTALELVQHMLSAIDSDEVSSIDDTTEARQAYDHVKLAYEELLGSRQWPFTRTNFVFESASSSAKPTRAKIPTYISEIVYLKYRRKAISYVTPEVFQDLVDQRDAAATNVVVWKEDGVPLAVFKDRAPTYWTSFDDEIIILDSFDSAVDASLYIAAAELTGYGVKTPCEWPDSDVADTFVVSDLPEKYFPLFRAMCRERAFYYLKQMETPTDTRFIRKQKIHLNKTDSRVRRSDSILQTEPHYGRK